MKLNIFTLLFIISLSACRHEYGIDHAQYIDPFICTSNDHGQTDVAAAVPFGMVKPCPDTHPIGHAGYDYNSSEIIGFSHTRFSGVGCRGVGGNIRVLPFANSNKAPKKQSYLKETELAKAGYYAVQLSSDVKVELTASAQVAYHKYTFPASSKCGVSIDLASSFVAHISEQHYLDDDGVLSGKVESVNVCKLGKYSFYYALALDKEGMTWHDDGSQITFCFTTSDNEVVKLFCALSVISEEVARQKLQQAMKIPFNVVAKQAYQAWNNLLNVVQVKSDDVQKKRLFYTHLYHATQSPFIVSESDGSYRGSDGKLYTNSLDTYYHGWSVWDTFRSKLPLLSFLYPEKYQDMLRSIAELYKQGKPSWATDTEPFITIRTEHTLPILLDASRKDILPFSLGDIYEALKEEAETLPYQSPDNVLESSYDYWALSEIAKDLGFYIDAQMYLDKAMQYQPLWKEKFLHLGDNADVMHADGLYEGTLWQYRWFVPFDMHGIQQLMGGEDVFENDLDYFFSNELFNIGNQPDIQVPYLYAYTCSPWKTQQCIHTLLNEQTNNWYGTHDKWDKPLKRRIFQDSPEGYIKEMDDDAGTMSAWYLWSSLGFYPIFPGSSEMVISTPQFDEYTIQFPERKLRVKTIKSSEKAIYIQRVLIDGEDYNSCFINFNRLVQGGEMLFYLDQEPNFEWGR